MANHKKIRCCWKQASFYFPGLFLTGLAFWSQRYIGKTNLHAVLSTIFLDTDGLWHVPVMFWHAFIIYVFLAPLVLMTGILFFNSYMNNRQWSTFYKSFFSKMTGFVLLVSGICWLNNLYSLPQGILEFTEAFTQNQPDIFARHYKDPGRQKFIFAKKPKNLILIYVEGLDANYQDEKIFKKNLLSSLLQFPHLSFQHFVQTSDASYTMAGTVASQCGIPLNVIAAFQNRVKSYNFKSYFLPNATCLGDILYQAGYHNVFLKGGSLDFSSAGTFFKTHHYAEVIGKQEWLKQGYGLNNMKGWGLTDDLLLKEAKRKLTQLMQQKKPFNLTMLTVDTHGPDGQINDYCKKNGSKDYTDIVECTAREISDLIQFVNDKGWMDQVTIVVTGDHLALFNPVFDKLTAREPRYVFNMIFSQNLPQKKRNTIVHEDLLPTILSALNVTWDNSHLALGYSGFLPLPPDLSIKEHLEIINTIDSKPSALYRSLWTVLSAQEIRIKTQQ